MLMAGAGEVRGREVPGGGVVQGWRADLQL